MPIIGRLNGSSQGGWTRYAKLIQDAGADALEVNVYLVPTDPESTSADVEQRYIDLVATVADSITIPVSVKIGPFFTSLPNLIPRLTAAGADGVVLFNRYLEPDIDLETLEASPNLVLSSRHELRLVLRWIAILRDNVQASLAATSGVHFAEDVVKALLVGADVTQLATVLLRYGPGTLRKLLEEVEQWMEEHEYSSVEQLKGSMSHRNCPDPSSLERANYMKALTSYTSEHPTV
jgi:dihydroorotate dehydrogenase (fumarate)